VAGLCFALKSAVMSRSADWAWDSTASSSSNVCVALWRIQTLCVRVFYCDQGSALIYALQSSRPASCSVCLSVCLSLSLSLSHTHTHTRVDGCDCRMRRAESLFTLQCPAGNATTQKGVKLFPYQALEAYRAVRC
jgi:hypothetical protein